MVATAFQPRSWNRRAVDLPMPLDAPVIRTVSGMARKLERLRQLTSKGLACETCAKTHGVVDGPRAAGGAARRPAALRTA